MADIVYMRREGEAIIRPYQSQPFSEIPHSNCFTAQKSEKKQKMRALKMNLRFADKVETHRVHANCAENKCEIIYALHMERHRQFVH